MEPKMNDSAMPSGKLAGRVESSRLAGEPSLNALRLDPILLLPFPFVCVMICMIDCSGVVFSTEPAQADRLAHTLPSADIKPEEMVEQQKQDGPDASSGKIL